MKKCIALLLCGVTILSVTGCYEKKIVVPQQIPIENPTNTANGAEYDLEQIRNDCNNLLNTDEYPHKVYIDFQVDDALKRTGLALAVDSTCTPEEAVSYATDYIKAFNDAVATQNFDYAVSGENYYGGFFDEYAIELVSFYYGDEEDQSKWIISQVIEAGTGDPVYANYLSLHE